MDRRDFVSSALVMGAVPAMAASNIGNMGVAPDKELYEVRTYEIKFRANRTVLENYLRNTLKEALIQKGVNHFLLFTEIGMSDPPKIWTVISYPSAAAFLASQQLHLDAEYVSKAREYNELGPEQTLYNRFTSSLLLAFDGMPKLATPDENDSVFELRTYEGYSEDAVRRKIKMFNEGEIALFHDTGLDPVFFGEMIIGPYKPCLTYMLGFESIEERETNWQKFLAHPGWKEMSGMQEYANTVSNIRRTFLKPLG